MSATGQNLFLIIVTVVAALLIAAVTLYLLVAFSHPEDRNQAWWPKIVVCFSMFIAISTVLLFPLDVANRRACISDILDSDCELTLPMREIWFGIYIVNVVLVYIITPFTLFYYEADSDLCDPLSCCIVNSVLHCTTSQNCAHCFRGSQFYTCSCCRSLAMRLKNSVIWTVVSMVVFGAILGIMYVVGGKVAYDTTLLTSGLTSMGEFTQATAVGCITLAGAPANGCNALADDVREEVFKIRPSFVIFVIAVASILGWLLLMVMGGVGLVALPLDMILAYASALKAPPSGSVQWVSVAIPSLFCLKAIGVCSPLAVLYPVVKEGDLAVLHCIVTTGKVEIGQTPPQIQWAPLVFIRSG